MQEVISSMACEDIRRCSGRAGAGAGVGVGTGTRNEERVSAREGEWKVDK